MSERHEDNIVRLATAVNPVQAQIWQNALEEEGVRSKVVGDYLEAGLGNVPGMGAELWVHEDDVERAKEILMQHKDFSEGKGDADPDNMAGAFEEDEE
jgi:hypothetical protein